jgi:nucleotide-binding universal stress UspA family protein
MNRKICAPFHVQLAVDGSEYSMAAAQLVGDLRLAANSSITILGVLTRNQPPNETTLRAAMTQAEQILSRAAIKTNLILLHGHPARELLKYGREHRPDLMVIGAKGLYATLKILLGGVAHQLVENARWPVLVARIPSRGLRRVLLATDGSPNCRLAAQYLGQFPLPEQTEIQVMHVQPFLVEAEVFAPGMRSRGYPNHWVPHLTAPRMPSPQAELNKQRGRVILAETKQTLETAGHRARGFIAEGDPASQILTHAQSRDIDLVVAGSRGLSAIEGWWWGSVSRKLVHYAHSSVLFVRTNEEDNHPE